MINLTNSTHRLQNLNKWLQTIAEQFKLQLDSLHLANADASFRQYYRIASNGAITSYIVMDSPVQLENPATFVQVQQIMQQAGLTVPKILAYQAQQGFLLLEDFGSATLLQLIQGDSSYQPQSPVFNQHISLFYRKAVDALIKLQLASKPDVLPVYLPQKLNDEMQLFVTWFVNKHLGKQLTQSQQQVWQQSKELILQNNLQAPLVYVHRDYMPRNFMPINAKNLANTDVELGILDFQDAVYGPITYDIACLMKDAFISWDEQHVIDITVRYWQQAKEVGLLNYKNWASDFAQFYQAVEWMGLQRHLKVAGIFARLSIRDGKNKYLADTARFIDYICHTCARYQQLKPLLNLVEQLVVDVPTEKVFSFGRM